MASAVHPGFQHEAFLYAGFDDFLDGALPFVREGVVAGEPVLVAVGAGKIEALRHDLGDAAEHVRFADMAELGSNPGRIIPAWRDFVDDRPPGAAVRGIGEPIWPERTSTELVECHRHESLLNVAFADTPGFRLLCPYDTAALAPDVVEEAQRTHPAIVRDGVSRRSGAYGGLQRASAPFDAELSEPPPVHEELLFGLETLALARQSVLRSATRAGLDADRAHDLALAVHELATNSVRHGGGHGILRIWQDAPALVCEVRDAGRIDQPLAGRRRPAAGQLGGYGLWLVHQLCDLVQLRCFSTGSAVRVHQRLA